VTCVLDKAVDVCARPQAIRCDNGPELASRHFLAWAIERKIEIMHIRRGKTTENAYVESFDGRLRDECLKASWFWNLFDARRKIGAWQHAYNSTRPHPALAYTAILRMLAFCTEVGNELNSLGTLYVRGRLTSAYVCKSEPVATLSVGV